MDIRVNEVPPAFLPVLALHPLLVEDNGLVVWWLHHLGKLAGDVFEDLVVKLG
jgi:hypothetical protein